MPRRQLTVQQPARLVLVDDHDLARAGLRNLLSGERDLDVVGEASNGRDALALCRRLQPDLALVDVQMPDLDGVAVTRALRDGQPKTRVIVITLNPSPAVLLEALRAGAAAYVLKGASKRELVSAIRETLQCRPMLGRDIARWLVGHLAAAPAAWQSAISEPLTEPEHAITRLVADGYSSSQISRELKMTSAAVSAQVRQVLRKLRVPI